MTVGSKTAELITRAEYARHAGISRSAVTRLVRRGQIPVHGPKKLINPAEADRARAASRVRFNIEGNGAADASGLAHRKAETETYRARLAKLAYERAVKRLLPKRSVELALAEASRVIVQQLNGLVAEAENLEAASRSNGVKGVRQELKRCVRDIRQGIADELTETADKIMKAGDNDG